MTIDIIRWFLGLFVVALFAGHYSTRIFRSLLHRGLPRAPTKSVEFPRWLAKTVGLVERAFFTIAIGAGLSGTAIAMIAWTTLKAVLYWSKLQDDEDTPYMVTGVLTNLVSLIWAIIGGMICQGPLWDWFLDFAGID